MAQQGTTRGDVEKIISYGKQSIDESDIKAVSDVLRSSHLTQGPIVNEFEEALAKYCDTKHAVAFSNGTAALHAAYYAAGLSEADEFLCTANTFVATANAGLYLGAKPIFIDIELDTGNIDASKIEEKITSKTKVISPVDFAGQPVDLLEIKSIAEKHNLILIEDACHALGATYNGSKIGAFSDMTVFSFHPIKSITTAEGGAVLTNNPEFAEKMRLFRTHGIEREDRWTLRMKDLGFNYRLSDLHSALGLSQLKRLDAFLEKRQKVAARYTNELSEKCKRHIIREDRTSAWHLYPILVPEQLRTKKKELLEKLFEKGIAAQVHYLPVYLQPYYAANYSKGLCKNAEEYYEREISLPIYPDLSYEDQTYVIETLNNLLETI